MKRPALDYAALPDVPVSQMTPAEQLIAKVAWISDNGAYGTLEAAKLLIDDIRAGSFTGATPRPSARPEAPRSGKTPRTDAFLKAGDSARVARCSYSELERLVLEVADFARQLELELAELRDLYNVTRGLIPGAKEAFPSPPR